jgi:hypothetical protein
MSAAECWYFYDRSGLLALATIIIVALLVLTLVGVAHGELGTLTT